MHPKFTAVASARLDTPAHAKVDMHAHIFERFSLPTPDWPNLPQIDAAADVFLREMDSNRVHLAVLVPFKGNVRYLRRWAESQPERFLYFCDTAGGFVKRPSDARRGCIGARLTSLTPFDGDKLVATPGWGDLVRLHELGGAISFFGDRGEQATLIRILRCLPELKVVINHLGIPFEGISVGPTGEPRIRWPGAYRDETKQLLAELATFPNVFVTFSGLSAASSGPFPFTDLLEHSAFIASCFGPSRIFWGSDYPWTRQRPGYRGALQLIDQHFGHLGPEATTGIRGRNAGDFLRRTVTGLA